MNSHRTPTKAIHAIFVSLCLGVFAGVIDELRAQNLYGATGGNIPSDLYILDPSNGSVLSTVGPIGFAVTGLAFDPTTGILYGSTSNQSVSAGSLVRIDTTTGTGTLIGSYSVSGQTMADITFASNGTLYGWVEPTFDDLYTINKVTGTATSVGNSGLGTFGSGLAANSADVIYYAGNGTNGPLRTVDKNTGLTTDVATMSGVPSVTMGALAFNSNDTLYGIGGPSTNITPTTDLLIINTTTGVITDLGPTLKNLDAIAFSIPEPSTIAVSLLLGGTLVMQVISRRRTGRRSR